jgi:hypothetical protein
MITIFFDFCQFSAKKLHTHGDLWTEVLIFAQWMIEYVLWAVSWKPQKYPTYFFTNSSGHPGFILERWEETFPAKNYICWACIYVDNFLHEDPFQATDIYVCTAGSNSMSMQTSLFFEAIALFQSIINCRRAAWFAYSCARAKKELERDSISRYRYLKYNFIIH